LHVQELKNRKRGLERKNRTPPIPTPPPPPPPKKKKKKKPTKEANCLPRQQLHSGNQQAAIKERMLNTFPELEPLRHSNNIHK